MAADGEWSHHLSTNGINGNGGTALLTYEQQTAGLPSLAESQEVSVAFDVTYFETSRLTGGFEFAIVRGSGGIVTSPVRPIPT